MLWPRHKKTKKRCYRYRNRDNVPSVRFWKNWYKAKTNGSKMIKFGAKCLKMIAMRRSCCDQGIKNEEIVLIWSYRHRIWDNASRAKQSPSTLAAILNQGQQLLQFYWSHDTQYTSLIKMTPYTLRSVIFYEVMNERLRGSQMGTLGTNGF